MASGRESSVMSSVNQEFRRKLFLLTELLVMGVVVGEQLTFERLLRILLGCLTRSLPQEWRKEKTPSCAGIRGRILGLWEHRGEVIFSIHYLQKRHAVPGLGRTP